MDFAGSVHCRVAGKAHGGGGGAAGWAVAWATDRREPALKPVRGAMFSEVEILLDGEGTSTLENRSTFHRKRFEFETSSRAKTSFFESPCAVLICILTKGSSLCLQL